MVYLCSEMRAPLEEAFEKTFLSGIQACVDFFEQRGNAGRGSVRDMTVARMLGAVKHQYRTVADWLLRCPLRIP